MSSHRKYIDPDVAKEELTELLMKKLGRNLSPKEHSTVGWIADSSYDSAGTIIDWIKEIGK